jgi:ribosomal protein S9
VGEIVTTTGGMMVTIALADLDVSATDVAVTVTCGGFGTTPGAVYRPFVLTVPQVAPLHPAPLTLQVTAVFLVPVTVAVNCCCSPAKTLAVVGEIVTTTGGMMVTIALADFVVSATEVAVTVTCGGLGTAAGAV